MKHYRALISVPIAAATDEAAYTTAFTYAAQLQRSRLDHCIVGHVETLFEVEPDGWAPTKVLILHDLLYDQVPERRVK